MPKQCNHCLVINYCALKAPHVTTKKGENFKVFYEKQRSKVSYTLSNIWTKEWKMCLKASCNCSPLGVLTFKVLSLFLLFDGIFRHFVNGWCYAGSMVRSIFNPWENGSSKLHNFFIDFGLSLFLEFQFWRCKPCRYHIICAKIMIINHNIIILLYLLLHVF